MNGKFDTKYTFGVVVGDEENQEVKSRSSDKTIKLSKIVPLVGAGFEKTVFDGNCARCRLGVEWEWRFKATKKINGVGIWNSTVSSSLKGSAVRVVLMYQLKN